MYGFDPAAEASDGLSTWLAADEVPVPATTASASDANLFCLLGRDAA